jgi:hypothetical protein
MNKPVHQLLVKNAVDVPCYSAHYPHTSKYF